MYTITGITKTVGDSRSLDVECGRVSNGTICKLSQKEALTAESTLKDSFSKSLRRRRFVLDLEGFENGSEGKLRELATLLEYELRKGLAEESIEDTTEENNGTTSIRLPYHLEDRPIRLEALVNQRALNLIEEESEQLKPSTGNCPPSLLSVPHGQRTWPHVKTAAFLSFNDIATEIAKYGQSRKYSTSTRSKVLEPAAQATFDVVVNKWARIDPNAIESASEQPSESLLAEQLSELLRPDVCPMSNRSSSGRETVNKECGWEDATNIQVSFKGKRGRVRRFVELPPSDPL